MDAGDGDGAQEAWVATGGSTANDQDDAVEMNLAENVDKLSLGAGDAASGAGAGADGDDDDDDDDVPDMEDFVMEEEEDDETVTIVHQPGASSSRKDANDNILRTRTYDLSVTYDKYYQTPRFWLIGYDEARQLLKPELALEDVSAEHAEKVVEERMSERTR